MAITLDQLGAISEAQSAKDLTNPTSGGDFAPPAEGVTRLRIFSYIETGVHTTTFKGTPKRKPRVEIGFELSGPLHPPREGDDGAKYPHRIFVRETVGTTVRNGYMKLFKALNYNNAHKNFISMIGREGWRGRVTHNTSGEGDQKRTYANLKNDAGYQIFSPITQDEETGEQKKIVPGPLLSDLRVFIWDEPSLDQWDSIFIDGQRDDGTSKNIYQEKIKAAENFVGSPIYDLLKQAGRAAELVPAKKVAKDEAQDDEGDDDDKPETPKPTPAPTPKPKSSRKASAPAPAEDEGSDDEGDPLAGV